MNHMEIRTDLALEARESSAGRCEKEEGVSFEENFDEATGIRVTTVRILNKAGEQSIGKPMGTYITLEAESLEQDDEDCHRQVSEQLAEHLRKLVRKALASGGAGKGGYTEKNGDTVKSDGAETCNDTATSNDTVANNGTAKSDGTVINSGTAMNNDTEQSSNAVKNGAMKQNCDRAKDITPTQDAPENENTSPTILTVGLGNRAVTSDSLGSRVVDELWITRHLEEASPKISGIIPGVMAQTGMESAQIVRAIVAETEPQLVIAIDALAARSVSRLGTTIQITDTGIQPGSGVGNHRHSLTKESLGVPVIAIGVPTVVSAAAIVYDTVQSLTEILRQSEQRQAADWMDEQSPTERYQLIRELVEPSLGPMMVTPKDIDERVSQLGHTIAEGMNIALLGAEDELA